MSSGVRTTLTAVWIALHTLQYGLHISALNGVQSAVTCGPSTGGGMHFSSTTERYLKGCIPMNSAQFGFVVAVFTVGGLIGALTSGSITRRRGRVGTLRSASLALLVGSVMVGLANTITMMAIGRIFVGLGCGLASVTVPLYLFEIAPQSIRRALGILNQFAIVNGILLGLCLSFPWAEPYKWRYIMLVAACLGVVQLIGSLFVRPNKVASGESVQSDEETPLVNADPKTSTMSIWDALRSSDPRIRRGLIVVSLLQLAQQCSGTSPVMYFTTRILTPVFPTSSRFVALFVLAFKVSATAVPAFIVERFGGKRLLLVSIALTGISCIALAFGLNTSTSILAVISILCYVFFYSIGLGPVIWVVLADVMPPEAQTAAGSIAVTVNWIANFAIGTAFLPVQEWLSGGKASGEGTIFFVFAGFMGVIFVALKMAFTWQEKARALIE